MKIAFAIGSIEGVPVSDKTKQLYLKWVNGELTQEQVLAIKSNWEANHT